MDRSGWHLWIANYAEEVGSFTENWNTGEAEFCSGNGIEHIVTSVRRPSTIGKIEAFHKAYVCEAWMFQNHQDFIRYWNYQRPHRGISYL